MEWFRHICDLASGYPIIVIISAILFFANAICIKLFGFSNEYIRFYVITPIVSIIFALAMHPYILYATGPCLIMAGCWACTKNLMSDKYIQGTWEKTFGYIGSGILQIVIAIIK